MGFDAERGDKVDVVSMRFADADVPVDAQPELLLGLEKNDVFRIGEYLALLLMATLVLLLVVKPIVAKAIEGTPQRASGSRASLPGVSGKAALTGPSEETRTAIAMAGGDVPHDEMINIDRVDGRMKASSVKHVGEIVDKHPEESLAIVRGWLHSEA